MLDVGCWILNFEFWIQHPSFNIAPLRGAWRHGDSNPRHPACKAGALPTELYPPVASGGAEKHFTERKRSSCTLRPVSTDARNIIYNCCLGAERLPVPQARLVLQPKRASTFRRDRENGMQILLRKEMIQPQVPLRLPCYDFIPVTSYTLGHYPLAVGACTSGATDFHDVTGGVYKTRERIHGTVDDVPLLAIPTSWRRVAASNPN